MTFPVFFPKNEAFEESQGANYGLEADTVLYNGPFVLSEWKHDASYTYTKNENYWDKDSVKLETVNYKIVSDAQTRVNLFNTDKADMVYLDSSTIPLFKDSEELEQMPAPKTFFLRFNELNPALANLNARKAINNAIDKESLANVLLGDGSVATDYYVPSEIMVNDKDENFQEDKDVYTKKDMNETKSLWATAKKEAGFNTVTLSLLTTDTEDAKRVAEYLKDQLEGNLEGLTVSIEQLPGSQRLEKEKSLNYDISVSSWTSDYPDPMNFLDMYVSDSGTNRTGFADIQYDNMILDIKQNLSLDTEKRWSAMEDAEEYLLSKQVIAPLYYAGISIAEKEYVHDVYFHNFGGSPTLKHAYVE